MQLWIIEGSLYLFPLKLELSLPPHGRNRYYGSIVIRTQITF